MPLKDLEARKAYRKEFYEKNKERIKERNRLCWKKNRKKYMKTAKKWRDKNKEYLNGYYKNRWLETKSNYEKHKKRLDYRKKQYWSDIIKSRKDGRAKSKKYKLQRKLYFEKNKKRFYQLQKIYKENNKIHLSEVSVIYRKQNKEYLKNYIKNWYKSNPHKLLEYNFKRRLKFPIKLSKEDYIKVLIRDGNKCVYCSKKVYWNRPLHHPLRLNLDHIDPNGGSTIQNLAVSCRTDNLSKHDISLEEWVSRVHPDRKEQIFQKIESIQNS